MFNARKTWVAIWGSLQRFAHLISQLYCRRAHKPQSQIEHFH